MKAVARNLIWQRRDHSKRGGKEAANPERRVGFGSRQAVDV